MAHSPGQRNETGESANRLTANKLGPSCRQMALMNLQSLLIASNTTGPRPLRSYDVIYCNVRFRGIPVRMRRTLWGVFLLCSKPVLNKYINSSYMLHSRCRNYVSMLTSTCSPTDESCGSVSSRGKRIFCSSKLLEWLRRTPNLLYNGCWEDYSTGGKAAEA